MSNIINLKSMRKLFTLALLCMFTYAGFAQDPGTYDETFGINGFADFAPSASHDFLEKVLIQDDGKIITAGRSRYDASNYDTYISRHNPDGTIDATYGIDGIAHIQPTPAIYINAGRDAAFGKDGLMYVCGYTYDYTNNQGFVCCFDENGFPNIYFGTDGVTISEYGGGIVYEAIDVDSEGRPVVTGYLNDIVLIRRYDLTGTPDASFGDNGTVIVDIPNSLFSFAYDIQILSDDRIVIAGFRVDELTYSHEAFVARLLADGSLDTTFGEGGFVIINASPLSDYANALSVTPEGDYIIAGHNNLESVDNLPRSEVFVTRVKADGTVDTSFGTNGFTKFETFSGNGCENNCETVTVAHDGQIFGSHYSFNHYTEESRAYIFNLDTNGQLKESFAGTGILPITASNLDIDGIVEIRTYSVALNADGKLIVGGYAYNNDGWSSEIFIGCVNTDVQPVIGCEEIEAKGFNVYPNPATSTVFVEADDNAQLSIIDLTGRCVKSVEITGNATINVEDINKGVYFMMIQNGDSRLVEKLVIK